jgi:hypothetical protein
MRFEESFLGKVFQIDSLESLPEDLQEWKKILSDTHKIVPVLLEQIP